MKFGQIILLGAASMLMLSCVEKKETKQEEKISQIKTEILKVSEITRSINLSTTLQGYERLSVSPSVNGTIEKIFVEPGDRVKAGDMLVRMDQMQYQTTKLAYSNLKVEMERVEALKRDGAISEQVYDQTMLSFEQTGENLKFLEENTYVKATFDGVVTQKNYEDGELYTGQPILMINEISTLKAYINVPEKNFPYVKQGMKVNIVSDIYPDKVFTSEVEIVYPTIDPTSHTFQVKLRIPNAEELLRPGMYVNTTLPLNSETSLIVPYQIVQKLIGSNERYIFVNENGKARRIFVSLGDRFDEKIEVKSEELKEGMEIVVVGQGKLVDGAKVNVVK